MNFVDVLEIYGASHNTTLDGFFNDIQLDARVNKEQLFLTIVERCGNMRPLFNVSDTFKVFSDNFFARYATNITKLQDTLELQYNPIENTDKFQNDSRTTTDVNASDANVTGENKVSAYNSNEYQPNSNDQSTSKGSSSNTHTDVFTTRVHGNIGVTTSQQMIESERDVVQFSVIDWIANKYAYEFMLGIY